MLYITYTPDGRGDVLDTVVYQNVRLSEVTVTDIPDSDHLPTMFSILNPARTREASDPIEKLREWQVFQSLASELISPNIQIYFSNEADKAAHDFSASIASAYRLSIKNYNFRPETQNT
jgi:hypothetical protein